MLAKDLVSDIIPAITGSFTVSQVIEHMAKFRVAHLPVVDQGEYLGLISQDHIMEVTGASVLSEDGLFSLLPVSIFDYQHIYEAIDLFARYKLTILPVLDPDKRYSGSITLANLVSSFSILTAAGQPGAILVLSLAPQDYSPTMLSRIIEDNNAKIISLYVTTEPNGRELTITIKVNTQETSSIMRSFDRYGYSVKYHFLASSQLDDFYRSRYDELMKYMNI